MNKGYKVEGENSHLALLHHMGEERWYLICHREGEGQQDNPNSFEKRRATPYSRGRCHGLVPHQQEHKV
jgi:hypothetical protein